MAKSLQPRFAKYREEFELSVNQLGRKHQGEGPDQHTKTKWVRGNREE